MTLKRDADARLLRSALEFATMGVPVFPCRTGEKTPLTSHGFKDASTDEGVVRQWWARWPTANVGIATGEPGFDILDVDLRDHGSGQAALDLLCERGLLDGTHAVVRTPSGGLHLYYSGTDQRCGRLADHFLDFKAKGGYVIAPPSVLHGLGAYEWHEGLVGYGSALNWVEICSVLTPVSSRALSPRRGRSAGAQGSSLRSLGMPHLADHVAKAPEGSRNGKLFWAVCEALRSGYGDMSPLVQAGLDAGLSRHEVERTVASALHRQSEGKQ